MATGFVIWQAAEGVPVAETERFEKLQGAGDAFFVTGFALLPTGALLYTGVKVAQKTKDSKEKK